MMKSIEQTKIEAVQKEYRKAISPFLRDYQEAKGNRLMDAEGYNILLAQIKPFLLEAIRKIEDIREGKA